MLLAISCVLLAACDRHRDPEPRLAVAATEPFAGDPHVFDCAACHGADTNAPIADLRTTCTRSGCHPQAWTRTVFHRVDPDIFSRCTNCHAPHTWIAETGDCNGCHAAVHGPAGTVTARSLAGAPVFPHERHARLACEMCHQLETRHADLVLTDPRTCTECHHGPPAAAECSACHRADETVTAATHRARLALRVWPEPRERALPFDHARHAQHAQIECTRCHEAATGWKAADNCMSCHTQHHRAEAACLACHTTPRAGAHTLDVHVGSCRECHGEAATAGVQPARNHCLVCHQDQVQHMPGGNCAECHKLAPGPIGGLR